MTSKGGLRSSVRQKGQALVLVLMFAVVTALLAFAVINNAILVTEKMEMQNAADATAYSISMLEARDLNFAAYTNRAMVANEVAIGQIIGLMSWATMVRTTGPSLNFYLQPLLTAMSTASLGALSAVQAAISAFISALTTIGSVVERVVHAIGRIAARAIPVINLAYSTGQRGYHLATLALSLMAISTTLNADDNLLTKNDMPNFTGAPAPEISNFGVLALAGHFVTHYPDLAFMGNSFVTSYAQDRSAQIIPHSPLNSSLRPGEDEQKAGMERFAAMVNASRDRFTQDRDGGWTVPIFRFPSISARLELDLGLLGTIVLFDFSFRLSFDLNRRGGSDVRFEESGDEQLYSWSAADTTSLDLDVFFRLAVPPIGLNFTFDPPTVGLPVGIGAAQVASNNAALGSISPAPVENMRYGAGVEGHNYGGSPAASSSTWLLPFPGVNPVVQSPSMGVHTNNPNRNYRLPRYNDTKAGPDPISVSDLTFGFESPYLIIALRKFDDEVINKADPGRPTGRFELAEGYANNRISVMAKSEVYFSRPNDLSYFARPDGRTEYASAFNPYWDARLVDTSVIDRATALAIEQQQLWLPDLPFGPIIDDFTNIVNWIRGA